MRDSIWKTQGCLGRRRCWNKTLNAMRRKTSAVAMLTEPCQDARLAKTTPGRNVRCAAKEPLNAYETTLTVNGSPSSDKKT